MTDTRGLVSPGIAALALALLGCASPAPGEPGLDEDLAGMAGGQAGGAPASPTASPGGAGAPGDGAGATAGSAGAPTDDPDVPTGGAGPGGASGTDDASAGGAAPDRDAGVDAGVPRPDGASGDARGTRLGRVLVFSKTTGFRHSSIGAGVDMLRRLGQRGGFSVDATEDGARFTDAGLAPYDVVVWLNTTGTPLDGAQRSAFERFIRRGGGYIGIHAAADTWGGRNHRTVEWPWYGKLLGGDAFFASHPAVQEARLVVEDQSTAATRHLGASFRFTDEWYDFVHNPRPAVQVLLSIDETSYRGGRMGADHPISWYHVFDGGRAFYTNLGHRTQTFSDARFEQHIAAALAWAAGGSW